MMSIIVRRLTAHFTIDGPILAMIRVIIDSCEKHVFVPAIVLKSLLGTSNRSRFYEALGRDFGSIQATSIGNHNCQS